MRNTSRCRHRNGRKTYDLIIIDFPPTLGFPETLEMAVAVDGVVVVALAGQTNRNAVGSALTTLQRVRANVVGLVLNEGTKDMSDSYHYYYGYYTTANTISITGATTPEIPQPKAEVGVGKGEVGRALSVAPVKDV